jgi:hypothetical protein
MHEYAYHGDAETGFWKLGGGLFFFQARRVGKSWRSGLLERPSGREDGRTKKWESAEADPRIDF